MILFWAVLTSALLAAFIALLTLAQHRILAKKRAAYDFIIHTWSQNNRENERVFRELANKEELPRILGATTSGEIAEKLHILAYMNMLELFSVSIKWYIVDEDVCKAIIGDKLVKVWKDAIPLVDAIRKKERDDEFYEHFGDLVNRWKEHPRVEKHHWFITLLKEIPRV